MLSLLLWIWEGIKYITGVLGNVISFKLSFVFLLLIAYYSYKVLSNVLEKSSWHKAKETDSK